jgi:hypothetical protein
MAWDLWPVARENIAAERINFDVRDGLHSGSLKAKRECADAGEHIQQAPHHPHRPYSNKSTTPITNVGMALRKTTRRMIVMVAATIQYFTSAPPVA